MKKILIIGGTGNLSKSTLQDLLQQGFDVAIFTRTEIKSELMGGVKKYTGDRNNADDLAKAIHKINPAIVIDFVCYTPEQAILLLPLIEDRLEQYIFISTVDVYGYPLSHIPFKEIDSRNSTNCRYAADKLACEELFQKSFQIGKLPLTIIRPAYSFGNNFVLTPLSRGGGKHLIPWLRSGKPILIFDNGLTLMHAAVATNTGSMIAAITGQSFTIGKEYTCGHEQSITQDEYIQICADSLGVKANIVHVPSEIVINSGHSEIEKTILPILTQFNIVFSIDSFKKDFPGFKWAVTHEQAAKEYIAFNDAKNNFIDPSILIYEDVIIEAYQNMKNVFKIPDRKYTYID